GAPPDPPPLEAPPEPPLPAEPPEPVEVDPPAPELAVFAPDVDEVVVDPPLELAGPLVVLALPPSLGAVALGSDPAPQARTHEASARRAVPFPSRRNRCCTMVGGRIRAHPSRILQHQPAWSRFEPRPALVRRRSPRQRQRRFESRVTADLRDYDVEVL